METFELPVGQSRRLLRFEPTDQSNTFKIYAVDKIQDWLDHESARLANVPPDGFLGTISVQSEGRFNFNGTGAFTGAELRSVAAQITRHPEFKAVST